MADPEPTSEPPDREPDPGQGLDGRCVRRDECLDVTDHKLGAASLQQHSRPPAERRDVLGRDRAAKDQEGRAPVISHSTTRLGGPRKLSAGSDEFGPTMQSAWGRLDVGSEERRAR